MEGQDRTGGDEVRVGVVWLDENGTGTGVWRGYDTRASRDWECGTAIALRAGGTTVSLFRRRGDAAMGMHVCRVGVAYVIHFSLRKIPIPICYLEK